MTTHHARIRSGTTSDVEALVALLGELFAIEADFSPDPDRQRRGLALLLDGSHERRVFVAEAGGRAVGMATVQVVISTAEGGPVGLVEDVVVARSRRGKGIGRLLLAAVEAWAAERGLARLQLLADRENAPALAFYGRSGWKPTQLACWRKRPAESPGTR